MGIRTEPVVWLIIAGLLLGMGWFMIGAGFPAAGDVYFHLRFARDFFNSCVEKVGYPDWDARPYDGKGTPAFRFYAPLAYVITGVFQIFGFPVGFSVKLSILLFAFAGAWGTYQWLISLGKSGWAASGGVFPFFVNPIMALHLFFTFFYQNLCAMLLFPLVLAGFSRAEKDPTSRNGLCLAVVAMGFVCWTHLPSAMMMGYGLITIVFFRWLSAFVCLWFCLFVVFMFVVLRI